VLDQGEALGSTNGLLSIEGESAVIGLIDTHLNWSAAAE
jgi:hypothetical protein